MVTPLLARHAAKAMAEITVINKLMIPLIVLVCLWFVVYSAF